MENNVENQPENNKLSDEELIEVAAAAALGVDGVSGLSSTLTDSIMNIPGLGAPIKGVKLSVDENELSFDLYINVEYGRKIPQLAWDIQSSVKKAVEDAALRKVKEVNIHVQGVEMPKEDN